MATILIPINQKDIEKIFSGEKKYIFKKRIAKFPINYIILYSTSPINKIVAKVEVKMAIEKNINELWIITKKHSAITENEFYNYFKNTNIGCAYLLGKCTKYGDSYSIEDFELSAPPKNFCYIKTCPYCDTPIINSHSKLSNSKTKEHIIPESLGNEDFVLPKGIICDKCNNYFAREIEKKFLNIETIKKLRSFHQIPSKKERIPDLNVLFLGEETKMEFDYKNNCMFIGLSPEAVFSLLLQSNENQQMIVKGIDINELKNNYDVSRMLVKIFTEICIYYSLEYNKNKSDWFFCFDNKMSELIKYVRFGVRQKVCYEYDVTQAKRIEMFSGDDFISRITLEGNKTDGITGMRFDLYELEFKLKIL